MADINGRPNLLEDYLMTLHNESWFYFTDINNKTYENLRLSEKIWDAINKTIIDNPHSLPLEMECNTGLENLNYNGILNNGKETDKQNTQLCKIAYMHY